MLRKQLQWAIHQLRAKLDIFLQVIEHNAKPRL
jgi:hypothetical protein